MEAEMVERIEYDVIVRMTRAQAADLHTRLQQCRGVEGCVADEFLRALWDAMGGWKAYDATPARDSRGFTVDQVRKQDRA